VITFLFVLHGLCAIALLGAITHQAAAVWLPARGPNPSFVTRFRAVKAASYVNAIIVLFLITFVLGAVVYPTYRIGARVFMEDLRMSAPVGSFEVKEHLITFALGLLPTYWYFWRSPLAPETEGARKGVVLVLAIFVWIAFLTGHVLNNIRGI
jgi:hypothetical protein